MDNPRTHRSTQITSYSPGYAPLAGRFPGARSALSGAPPCRRRGRARGLCGCLYATGLMLRLKLVIGRPAPGRPPPTDRAGTRPARRNDASRKRWTDGADLVRRQTPRRLPTQMQRGSAQRHVCGNRGDRWQPRSVAAREPGAIGRRRYRSVPGRRRCCDSILLAGMIPVDPRRAALQPLCCRRDRDRRVRYGPFHLCPDRNPARPLTQDLPRVPASTL